MIYELDNFVSNNNLDYINNEISKAINICPSILNIKFGSYRDGKTINISEQPDLKELDSFLFKNVFASSVLSGFISRRYCPSFGVADSGYEFHRYASGEICNIHNDTEVVFKGVENEKVMLRFASLILHLNTPKSGGELIFPHQNKTVKTEAGKLVIFPPYGFAPHYTTESTSNRDIIVTWLVYKDILVHKK